MIFSMNISVTNIIYAQVSLPKGMELESSEDYIEPLWGSEVEESIEDEIILDELEEMETEETEPNPKVSKEETPEMPLISTDMNEGDVSVEPDSTPDQIDEQPLSTPIVKTLVVSGKSYNKTMLDAAFNLGVQSTGAVNYHSNNTSVVQVDSNGLVTICGAGEAVITARCEAQTEEIKVTVARVNQTITMSTATITKKYGAAKFQVNATSKTPVTYRSSDTSVLTVDSKGYVTIVGKSTKKSAYVVVNAPQSNVYNAAPEKKVLVKWEKADQSISATNKSYTIGSKKKALGAKAKTKLSYKSSDSKVVVVNGKGQVTAKKVGTAKITITAKSSNQYNGVKKVITVKVSKKGQTIAASNKVYTLGEKNKDLGAKAKTKLVYTSSDSGVVAVNSKGQITSKKVGTAKITITAKSTATYKSVKKTITITVNPQKTTISKLTSVADKKMSVVINKVAGVSGYQIRYANKSNMASAKSVTTSNTNRTITISEIGERDIKYYVQVRPYKSVGVKNYYGGWSAAKAVTVKGHEHSWRPIYKTTTHPATGHWETRTIEAYDEEVPVYDIRTICKKCGYDFKDSSETEIMEHVLDHGAYHTIKVQVDTKIIHHEKVTERAWVEDTPEIIEKKLVGYRCSSCGITK